MLHYWPQITYLALSLAGLILALTEHGEPKKGNHNAWHSIITAALVFWLLWVGGFFD